MQLRCSSNDPGFGRYLRKNSLAHSEQSLLLVASILFVPSDSQVSALVAPVNSFTVLLLARGDMLFDTTYSVALHRNLEVSLHSSWTESDRHAPCETGPVTNLRR